MLLTRTSLAVLVVLQATGCASRSDAGAALVAAGAVVAVGAAVATTQRACVGYDCTASTSRNAGAAAAGVAAGVGLAAIGAAVTESDPMETKPKRRNPPPKNPFRLVRPAEDPVTPSD